MLLSAFSVSYCLKSFLTNQPRISHLFVYPIKALDGIDVSSAAVTRGGALEHDRAYMIIDEYGKYVRGKSNKKVHLLRTRYDLAAQTVTLTVQGTQEPFTFHLNTEQKKLERWLCDFFEMRVYLVHNSTCGYPDDRKAWGPTIVSEASLERVATWFPGLTASDLMRRFRPNIVLAGVEAFWEDRLFGEPGAFREFHIGAVEFDGVNPCARCVVPTRNPESAEEYSRFQKTFTERRKETLPPWSATSRFDHFYRMCVNTRIHPSEAEKVLQVNDEVKLP